MIELDRYVAFLCKHKISPVQYFFLQLVKENRLDLIQEYKKAFNTSIINTSELEDLLTKEFLIKTKTGFKLTNKFLDLYIDIEEAVEEIYELYPTFITTKEGVKIPLTAMDRRIFKEIYLKAIKGSLEEHKEVKKDINYGVEHKLLSVGINKFVTSKMWQSIRKLRKEVTNNKDAYSEDF